MLYPATFGEVLGAHVRDTLWPAAVSLKQVPPGAAALATRCTSTTLQTLPPWMVAVHGANPSAMLTAKDTSAWFTTPSWFRSQPLRAVWAQAQIGEERMPTVRQAMRAKCFEANTPGTETDCIGMP